MLVKTGVGYCTRNHIEPLKEEGVPPCIGDLNCNPHICKHSVVTESRKDDVIRNYLDAKRKINEPDQIYLKEHWIKVRDSYAAMLEQLDINPEQFE